MLFICHISAHAMRGYQVSLDSSLKLFCRCLEFHCSVLDRLFTQSSLRLPSGMTFANGNLEADIVT